MIRRYENNLEYCKSEIDILQQGRTIYKVITVVKRRLENFSSEVSKYDAKLVENLEKSYKKAAPNVISYDRQSKKLSAELSKDDITDMMLAHWDFANFVEGRYRVAVYFLFNIGIVLFGLCMILSIASVLTNFVLFLYEGIMGFNLSRLTLSPPVTLPPAAVTPN
jgi:hypothetical protein